MRAQHILFQHVDQGIPNFGLNFNVTHARAARLVGTRCLFAAPRQRNNRRCRFPNLDPTLHTHYTQRPTTFSVVSIAHARSQSQRINPTPQSDAIDNRLGDVTISLVGIHSYVRGQSNVHPDVCLQNVIPCFHVDAQRSPRREDRNGVQRSFTRSR